MKTKHIVLEETDYLGFNPFQLGFRPRVGTGTAMVTLTEDLHTDLGIILQLWL